ncbi:hypothetical protein [Limimaricola soesokkakensis]|uniref:hypothetical protein n=1 Tax=Limimaricola soesokkakensis TaxID=1343159 RepID=UPI0035114455
MRDVELRIQQVQARLRDLKAIERKQVRRDETRRKIIFGAAALQLLEDLRSEDVSGEKAKKFMRHLDERITRPIDRQFVGLGERTRPPNKDE